MRISIAILVLFTAIPVSAADVAPVTPTAESDEATLSQARDVLERWERVLTEEGPERISDSHICRMYLDAWASVDLDRAIELERKHRCRSSQGLLARRLASAHRWDDVLAMMDANPEDLHYDAPESWAQTAHGLAIEADRFHYRAPEFWAHVACYGARIGDMEIVALAGRRVELIAAAEPSEAGLPPRPSEPVAVARFYVAASRLDVLRQQSGEPEADAAPTEQALRAEQSKELRAATEDLWRAAGGIVPQRSWFVMTPEFSSFQGFAALESWEWNLNRFGLNQPETDNFVHGLVEAFHEARPSAPRCKIDVVLPELSRAVTSAWLVRQTRLGRTSVALTTLWLAPGSDVDRARNLAVMSRELPSEEESLAVSWREAADGVLQTVDEMDDPAVRGLAELSLAYSSAGDFENATRCIDATFGADSADGGHNRAAKYETRQVLLQAIAALPDAYPRLPEVLEGFGDREFSRARLPEYEFHVDGLARRMDLTHVIPESRILEESRYKSHADYHQAHDAGNWPGAMEAAIRHHAGNPAWAREYCSLAEESVQAIGLEATLDWCEGISDAKARFAAEIAAVGEAVRAWQKTLPGIDADDADFVTPAVPWPSGC